MLPVLLVSTSSEVPVRSADSRRRWTTRFHRYLANPIARRTARFLPGQVLIETTGRVSGLPRRTPVGGRLDGATLWLVSDHGRHSQYVRNIEAQPRVRVQVRGRWRAGTAHLLDDDDVDQRLATLPAYNSALVRRLGTELLTVRVDLDPA
jgi:deazaflavin-dependent oxidoreductase (nitroreductase family)